MRMLEPFKSAWDEHLGHTTTAACRIELDTQAAGPMPSVSYRVVPKARDFEKTEIDKMPSMNVIKPFPTERASPVVYGPKRTKPSDFAWITANAMPLPYGIHTPYRGWMRSLTVWETHNFS